MKNISWIRELYDYNIVCSKGIIMKKDDIRKILDRNEIAKAIDRDPSLINHMPKQIPERFHKPLLKAARRKVRLMLNALSRMGNE